MRRTTLVLLAALLLPAAAIGQTPTPAPSLPNVSDADRALARELRRVTGADALMTQTLTAMRGAMANIIRNGSGKSPEEAAAIVDEVLMPEMTSRIGELSAALVEIYASTYTEDEMRQMIAFYETPIGKRIVELAPKVSQLSIIAGQTWGRTVGAEAMRKHADELRRRGVKI